MFQELSTNVLKPVPSFLHVNHVHTNYIILYINHSISIYIILYHSNIESYLLFILWHRFAISPFQVERKSLADLKVGDQLSGQVVEVPNFGVMERYSLSEFTCEKYVF